jgi:hypothetical protein
MYLLSEQDKKKYHYTYRLICIETEQEYIGSRSSDVESNRDNYWSSSKVVKDMIKNGFTFTKEILLEFSDRTTAVEHEIYLHNLHDVGNNPKFLNQVKQTSAMFDTTGKKFPGKGTGRKDPEQTRKNKSAAAGKHLKGTTLTESHKKKIGNKLKGRASPPKTAEGLAKLRQCGLGRVPGNKGVPAKKVVCRLSDRREMDLGNFMKWSNK